MQTNQLGYLKEAKSRFLSLSLPDERQMGTIHSVFRNSFNVDIDGRLINFSRTGMSLSAHGCVIAAQKMEEVLNSCRMGNIVRLNNSEYTIYTETKTVYLDTSDLPEVDLSVPDITDATVDIAETTIYKKLKEVPFKDEIGLTLNEQTSSRISQLLTVYTCDEKELLDIISFFLGRGKGLTPSGDDLLVGFSLVRKAVLGDSKFEKALKQSLAIRRTTDISDAYYKAYFGGFISSHLIQLIRLLSEGNSHEASDIIQAIGQYGHTSGYDSLYGCYLGMQSIINERGDKV